MSRLRGFFNTLTGRIVLGGMMINLLLMPLLLYGVTYLVKRSLESSFVDQVRMDSHLLAENISQNQDPDSIRDMIDEIMLSGRYVYARLVDESGNTPADPGFQEDFFFGQHGDNVYYIAVPLPLNEEFDSDFVLHLGYDETPVVEHIEDTVHLCITLAGIYMVMILLASGIFGPLIARPLRSLRAGARNITCGGYDQQLLVKTSISEIRSLANDFETMRQELVRHNKELEYQSLHDALTGLPNRLLLQDRLRQAIYSAQREDHMLALFMIDLDGFKAINDTLGHHYGDILLQQVSSRIQGALRKTDTIARFGGDEFCILLPAVASMEHATEIARKVTSTLEQPFIFEDKPYNVGMSIGIALYPEHGTDSALLLRHADVAMYVAKNNNLDYTLYDASQDKRSISRLSLMWDLRRAIDNGDLILEFQPVVTLATGAVESVESLVRWHHPKRGMLMPEEFIALSEQANLIKPLTLWVMENAARQCSRWQTQGRELSVSINLSPRSLHDRLHPRQLLDIIASHGADPRRLILEFTETAIISDPRGTRAILEEFSAAGMALAIDDFGTGYSSLSALKKLPLDIIKIDKSFIMDMAASRDDLVIVRSTIDLAHNMGMMVVAEGVISAAIQEQLLELGCDRGQGYHLGRPMDAAQLEAWLDGDTGADHACGGSRTHRA
ncbi:MAG TPA: EAL domain-containing protein [Gammaproteobacteria bacterium]|nr:EAL domain-containing protein [Gammaproteobacteria bacterium]